MLAPLLRDQYSSETQRPSPGDRWAYKDISELIQYTDGWKELRYLTAFSGLLGYAYRVGYGDREKFCRRPQPEHWQRVIEHRDGAQSEPSVVVYRLTLSDSAGSTMNPNWRFPFKRIMPDTELAQQNYGLTADPEIATDGRLFKEMMIIAKRGFKANYQTKSCPQIIPYALRPLVPGRGRRVASQDEGVTWNRRRDGKKIWVMFDAYKDIDNLGWSIGNGVAGAVTKLPLVETSDWIIRGRAIICTLGIDSKPCIRWKKRYYQEFNLSWPLMVINVIAWRIKGGCVIWLISRTNKVACSSIPSYYSLYLNSVKYSLISKTVIAFYKLVSAT